MTKLKKGESDRMDNINVLFRRVMNKRLELMERKLNKGIKEKEESLRKFLQSMEEQLDKELEKYKGIEL